MTPRERGAAPFTTTAAPLPIEPPVSRWYQRFAAVLLIILCLEIGLFLMAFPWTEYWQNNYLGSLVPQWRRYWMNPYLRGGVSGLGVANLYLSVTEIFRLRRFAKRP
jgi:hypothetical protein